MARLLSVGSIIGVYSYARSARSVLCQAVAGRPGDRPGRRQASLLHHPRVRVPRHWWTPGPRVPVRCRMTNSAIKARASTMPSTRAQRGVPLGEPRSGCSRGSPSRSACGRGSAMRVSSINLSGHGVRIATGATVFAAASFVVSVVKLRRHRAAAKRPHGGASASASSGAGSSDRGTRRCRRGARLTWSVQSMAIACRCFALGRIGERWCCPNCRMSIGSRR